ncbi:MAG TPA: type II toxin-antitoxin system YafQ family toxin [Longimicrobiales bacterium]|nr:type II toxin-antitoxin system YafQ family toxin [Longimicrobiales bacterium]
MYRPRATRQFKKDRNRLRKRGYDLDALTEVMRKLVAGERLGPEHRPHTLQGEFADCWECHIKSDWLLIWRIQGDELVFIRTGTHSDLFD